MTLFPKLYNRGMIIIAICLRRYVKDKQMWIPLEKKYKMVSLTEGYDLRKLEHGLDVWLFPFGSIIPELYLSAF